MSKFLTKIFQEEIADTGLCEEQQGFRKNRSAIDAIFTIRQITEKPIKFNKPAFMCFVDLIRAFDRVKLEDVVPLLQKREVHPRIITIINKLNTNNYTSIKIADKLSELKPHPIQYNHGRNNHGSQEDEGRIPDGGQRN